MITVFTPTYNRAYILPKLYESLCKQTSMDFEWLIVDDGSSDTTTELVANYKLQNTPFPILYFRQENAGKHIAINRGVQEAKGELFFIVDSDDQLTEDAIEWINVTYSQIKGLDIFAGLSGIRVYPDGRRIGGGPDWGTIDATNLERVTKYRIAGDMAEIYITDILRQYPFPSFAGERFCPEAMVWNRIAQKYKLRYCHHPIYICEYLEDGLTAKIIKIRHRSPKASMLYYAELQHMNIPISEKMKANVNFWRFAPMKLWSDSCQLGMLNLLSLIGCPMGCMYSLVDKH